MISNVFRLQELEVLAGELDQHISISELLRQIRPPISEKVSPETYRSVFKVSEVMRIAREVADERGVAWPFAAFRQADSDKEDEDE